MSNIVGLIIVLGSIYICMIMSGQKLNDYYDVPSLVIVLGGSIGAAAAGFGLDKILKIPVLVLKAILPLPYTIGDVITGLQRMADKVRSAGLPALQSEIPVAFDEYTKRGIKLLVSGADSSLVQSNLEAELSGMEMRHAQNTGFLDSCAGYFPAFGMLGTVLGIVQAMGNIDDVGALGTALAIALLTTLYGVFGANVLILPISSTLKKKSAQESLYRTVILEGFLAIQAGLSSQLVGDKAKAVLSNAERLKIEGGKGLSKKKGEKHIELTTYMNALDQERALALMAEIKEAMEKKQCGQDDVKFLLAQLINDAEDKILAKDFASEYMKLKKIKKLPKGSKMPKKRKKGGKGGAKKRTVDEEED